MILKFQRVIKGTVFVILTTVMPEQIFHLAVFLISSHVCCLKGFLGTNKATGYMHYLG